MLETSGSTVWELNPDYTLYGLDIGDGVYRLFSLKTGAIYKLNRSSYQILSLIDGHRTLDAIAAKTASSFSDAGKDRILKDIQELLSKLMKKNIAYCKGGESRDVSGA